MGTETNQSSDDNTVEEETTTRTVSFTINDGTDGISGATLVIDEDTDNTKTTGGVGGCTASLSDGQHTVQVSKTGYVTKTETITVDADHTSFTISLTTE